MSSISEKITEYFPMLSMAGLILLVQIIALLLASPMEVNEMQAFEDPTNVSYSIYYIGLILGFTLLVLLAIKKNLTWLVKLFIYIAVLTTLYYIFYALLTLFPGLSLKLVALLSGLLATGMTLLLYKYPEWYVVDIIGVCLAAGVSALIGISLSVVPIIVLLLLLAIYDALSVYKTKHMVTMAEGLMDLKLPILFVIPKHRTYSFRKENFGEGEEREAFFMGLGDAVMPTLLVVSAYIFANTPNMFSYPVLGAIFGTLVGFFVLSIQVMKGNPQAGLPFLNTGVILGFFAGTFLSGTPLF